MGKRHFVALTLIVWAAVGLTGCAGASPADQARDACIKLVLKGSNYDHADESNVTVTDVGSALFDAGVNKTNDTSEKHYMVAGDVIVTKGSTESRKTVACSVDFKNDAMTGVEKIGG